MHSHLDALDLLRSASNKHGIHLSVLVAETGVWASPQVFEYLAAENGTGCYFPNTRRYRAGAGEKPSQVLDGVRLDNNSYANHAAKRATGLGRGAEGFEVCHVWPRSCYDARYHTCVANLVLLPRPLAGLTDHDPEITAALAFRSYELYGWWPAESPQPTRPDFYPVDWRAPEPFTEPILRALERRRADTSGIGASET